MPQPRRASVISFLRATAFAIRSLCALAVLSWLGTGSITEAGMTEPVQPETQVVAGVELVFEFRMTHPGCKGHAFDALPTFVSASPLIHDAGVPTFGPAPDRGCVSAAISSDRAPPAR